jgi:MerR family transcriptional regulator, heat shock protein HspR
MTDQPERVDRAGPADVEDDRRALGLAALNDADAPVYTIGQAADLLGVPVPALRRLDDAGVLTPQRSAGGQRRYSRRQLDRAERLLALISEGTSIASAGRIADLEREVADLRDQLTAPEPREDPDSAGR